MTYRGVAMVRRPPAQHEPHVPERAAPEFGQLLRAVDPRLEEGPSAKSAARRHSGEATFPICFVDNQDPWARQPRPLE